MEGVSGGRGGQVGTRWGHYLELSLRLPNYLSQWLSPAASNIQLPHWASLQLAWPSSVSIASTNDVSSVSSPCLQKARTD